MPETNNAAEDLNPSDVQKEASSLGLHSSPVQVSETSEIGSFPVLTSFARVIENSRFWQRVQIPCHPQILELYQDYPTPFFVLTERDKWLLQKGFLDPLPKTRQVRELSLQLLSKDELEALSEQFELSVLPTKAQMIEQLLPNLSPDLIPTYAAPNQMYMRHLHRLAKVYLGLAVEALENVGLNNDQKLVVIKNALGDRVQFVNDSEILTALESESSILESLHEPQAGDFEKNWMIGILSTWQAMGVAERSALGALVLGVMASVLLFALDDFPLWVYIFVWGVAAVISFPVLQERLKQK
ncbi:hypothetical protein [Thiomicrorhabdus xiamenensis]|uniref:Uncharacterized protein n=1 Tax=Thiomicrorhabdus xiamenensis TaxID=2739063 RepID=A0A7D4SZ06_9GAMM|nr:hypothetical protein [Thiomicrorhabdus xiamenensis]QKI89504.1 hypothetical protein HQN79_07940 [Thiomicrorhabdus xiamenensis]